MEIASIVLGFIMILSVKSSKSENGEKPTFMHDLFMILWLVCGFSLIIIPVILPDV